MTIAWDGFRIVDNNTHSVIFMLPDDPCTEDYQDYALKVENPTINLDILQRWGSPALNSLYLETVMFSNNQSNNGYCSN